MAVKRRPIPDWLTLPWDARTEQAVGSMRPRHVRVLRRYAEGRTDIEIAVELGVHRSRAYQIRIDAMDAVVSWLERQA